MNEPCFSSLGNKIALPYTSTKSYYELLLKSQCLLEMTDGPIYGAAPKVITLLAEPWLLPDGFFYDTATPVSFSPADITPSSSHNFSNMCHIAQSYGAKHGIPFLMYICYQYLRSRNTKVSYEDIIRYMTCAIPRQATNHFGNKFEYFNEQTLNSCMDYHIGQNNVKEKNELIFKYHNIVEQQLLFSNDIVAQALFQTNIIPPAHYNPPTQKHRRRVRKISEYFPDSP